MSYDIKLMDKLRDQLDWRGPNGKSQSVVTLTRDQGEFVYSVLLARAYRREKIHGTADA